MTPWPPSTSTSSPAGSATFTAVDHVSFDVKPGRDLRLPRRQRRRQVHHHPHAVRPAAADLRHRDGRRHRRREGPGGRQAPHRLHVAAVLAVRAADRRSEHPVLRRHLRAARRASRGAPRSSCSRWPGSKAASTRSRATCPAAGGSGWRSAAPSSIEPPIVFLDEPTGGVDPLSRRQFWDLIGDLSRERASTVLVTTHYLDEAEHCHRIAIIQAGKLAALGTAHRAEAGASPTGRSSRFRRPHRSRRWKRSTPAGGREDQPVRHRGARRPAIGQRRRSRSCRRALARRRPRGPFRDARHALARGRVPRRRRTGRSRLTCDASSPSPRKELRQIAPRSADAVILLFVAGDVSCCSTATR